MMEAPMKMESLMCGIDRWSQVLGMAMGQVRAGFFYTQTHPMGQDPLPELGPFNK